MGYDRGLVERIRDLLTRLVVRSSREKNVFGGWGFLEGRSLFAVAADEGLLVKTTVEEYTLVLAWPGITPFAPMGDRPMSTWVVANDDATADDRELSEWLQRGLRAVRAKPSVTARPVAKKRAPARKASTGTRKPAPSGKARGSSPKPRRARANSTPQRQPRRPR